MNEDVKTQEAIDEAARIASSILWKTETRVRLLEKEIVYLGEAFNILLDKTGDLDKKLSELTSIINVQKKNNSSIILDMLKDEITSTAEQLKDIFTSTDPSDLPVIQDNLQILKDNKEYILKQIDGLKELRSDTREQERHLEVFDKAISQFTKAIDVNGVFRLTNLMHDQIETIQEQVKDVASVTDPNDIPVLRDNITVLGENIQAIRDEMEMIFDQNPNIKRRPVEEHFETLAMTLEQFQMVVDEKEATMSFTQMNA